MTPVFQSLGNGDPPPNHRLAGETYAQYLERRRAWSAGRSGFGTAGGSAGMSQPAGMPPPIPASAMPGAGQVGNYAVPVTRGLPQPVAVMPVARAPGPFPAQFQVGSQVDTVLPQPPDVPYAPRPAGVPFPWTPPAPKAAPFFRGPGDALAPGLRTPLEGPPVDLGRAMVLAATLFDTAWGTPPDGGPGLAWSPQRFLYEATNDVAGGPYKTTGPMYYKYLQPYQDPALGTGRWNMRWVEAQSQVPDPAMRLPRFRGGSGAGGDRGEGSGLFELCG